LFSKCDIEFHKYYLKLSIIIVLKSVVKCKRAELYINSKKISVNTG